MVRPSLETLSKMADDKKIGGVFAGQRRGVVIIDAASHEEVGSILANPPFWSRLSWNVTPLQSYRSTVERDSKAMENLKHSNPNQQVHYTGYASSLYGLFYSE